METWPQEFESTRTQRARLVEERTFAGVLIRNFLRAIIVRIQHGLGALGIKSGGKWASSYRDTPLLVRRLNDPCLLFQVMTKVSSCNRRGFLFPRHVVSDHRRSPTWKKTFQQISSVYAQRFSVQMSVFVVPPQIGRSKEMVGPGCVRFRIGFVGDRPEACPCRHFALSYKGRLYDSMMKRFRIRLTLSISEICFIATLDWEDRGG